MIEHADREQLLHLARAALGARVRSEAPPVAPVDVQVAASGAFVTLYSHGELRGCLGTLDPRGSLTESIARLAWDVAREDHRFEPLRVEELDDTHLEISVLTEPEIVRDIDDIVIGRDGLIVEQGERRGLLLPQVATEHGWDRERFLGHTCLKARLPADAWRQGATIFRFQAEVFGERD